MKKEEKNMIKDRKNKKKERLCKGLSFIIAAILIYTGFILILHNILVSADDGLSLEIEAPNGGEVWSDIQLITWEYHDGIIPILPPGIAILYQKEGEEWQILEEDIGELGNNNYSWDTRTVPNGNYKVKIELWLDENLDGVCYGDLLYCMDSSNDWFTIQNNGHVYVNVTPVKTAVYSEESFVINITVNTEEAIAGAQFDLFFDEGLLIANDVVEGDLFAGVDSFFNPGGIDNSNGRITGVFAVITAKGKNVSTPGTLASIHFTTKADIGVSSLNLSQVIVADCDSWPIPVVLHNGSITILTYLDSINVTCSPCSIPEDSDNNAMVCPGNPVCSEVTVITVTINGTSNITNATINLSPLGWLDTVPLQYIPGTDTWYILVNATAGTAIHDGTRYVPHSLILNVTDEYGHCHTNRVNITVWKNGDANGDGIITLYDATYLAKWYFHQPGFEYLPENVADVSGDCQITLYDATYLAKWYFNQPGFEVRK